MYKVKGFPTEIGDYIELPDVAELLMYPNFTKVPIELYYKYGSDFHRMLIDKAPLRNCKKNILVFNQLKILGQNLYSSFKPYERPYQWHVDQTNLLDPEKICHVLVSNCEARTEFNCNDNIIVDFDLSDSHEFSKKLDENKDKIGLTGKKIDPNRFVTFTDHLHREPPAERLQFRFFLLFEETDEDVNDNFNIDKHIFNKSFSHSAINKTGIATIMKLDDQSIYLNYNQIQKIIRGE